MKKRFIFIFSILTVMAWMNYIPAVQESTVPSFSNLKKEIIESVLTAPHYGVFDLIGIRLNGVDIIIEGQVMMPITKMEAEKQIAKINGIGKITNIISVLPLSRIDDSIRLRVYRRLFGTADLYRYNMGANPSIHIIVNRGRVKLEGIVNTESDKKLAYMVVRSLPGIFSVQNNLIVES